MVWKVVCLICIIRYFQSQSEFSETSSMSESKHLFSAEDGKDNKDQSNVPMTSFNFINSIIGSGIIGKCL